MKIKPYMLDTVLHITNTEMNDTHFPNIESPPSNSKITDEDESISKSRTRRVKKGMRSIKSNQIKMGRK